MHEHGTKTTPVFLPADGEASWSQVLHSALYVMAAAKSTTLHDSIGNSKSHSGIHKNNSLQSQFVTHKLLGFAILLKL